MVVVSRFALPVPLLRRYVYANGKLLGGCDATKALIASGKCSCAGVQRLSFGSPPCDCCAGTQHSLHGMRHITKRCRVAPLAACRRV